MIDCLKMISSKSEKVLLIFDNIEEIILSNKDNLIKVVETLLSLENIHILITSRFRLGAIQNVREELIMIERLKPE